MKRSTRLTLTAVGATIAAYIIVRYHKKILKTIAPPVMDSMMSGKDVSTLTLELAEAGDKLRATLETRPDTEHNRRTLSHLIGMERWGKRRLLVALGESLIMDEYNGYRPRQDRSWDELKAAFLKTRHDTVNIAHQLAQTDPNLRIPHNMFGDLTVLDWLFYLRLHADGEVQKMQR